MRTARVQADGARRPAKQTHRMGATWGGGFVTLRGVRPQPPKTHVNQPRASTPDDEEQPNATTTKHKSREARLRSKKQRVCAALGRTNLNRQYPEQGTDYSKCEGRPGGDARSRGRGQSQKAGTSWSFFVPAAKCERSLRACTCFSSLRLLRCGASWQRREPNGN